jgi:phospholipase C
VFDPNNLVTSFHLITQCVEEMSASWNQSHVDWNYHYPEGQQAANLDGFVWSAGEEARAKRFPLNDTDGLRTMGYYDGDDLNYYYFMASNFATSDRFFNPVMARTGPNREYMVAATSQGYAYPVGTTANDKALTATTIFQALQAANPPISWKIYVNPTSSSCSGPRYDPACLITLSHIVNFKWGQSIPTLYPNNVGTIGIPNSDFENDLANNTLPQVVEIENAYSAGLDEHPTEPSDLYPINVQTGANYISSIINELMASTSWKDSALFFTYDENGGAYDHVAPQPAVSPDGIKPVDLVPGDICTQTSGPTCDFVYTGYRVPVIVISPFTKKNYVSHIVYDATAILKFIETRFNLPPLTNRDAAQQDMSEFFDFAQPAWMIPPTPPVQNTSGPCYLDHLP